MQIKNEDQRVELCVLGAGPVAAVAMLLAKQNGLNAVQIMVQSEDSTTKGVPRTYAIAPQVQAGLAALCVWGLLTEHSIERCDHMRVFWQHGEQQEPLHLSAEQAGVAQLCSFVSEHDLLAAIATVTSVNRAHTPAIVHTAAQAPELQTVAQGMRICVPGHAPVLASLCIIAQGANSPAAAQLGLAPTVYDYGHSAVVAVLHSDQAGAGTAWQWLGGAQQGHDVMALLPLPSPSPSKQQGSCYGLVWSQATAQAQRWRADAAGLLAAVQARTQGAVGELSLRGATGQFPLYSSAAQLTTAHAVLLGDSAHKIHPLAGQGLNMGFEDVFTLFDVLAQRESWRSVGDARLLARYARRRHAHANPKGAVVHAIASRGRWPHWLQGAALKGLQMQNDWPALGAAVRRTIVNAATRGRVEQQAAL
jgi:2-polyprenyl-6-methoxyphenol hydroxylase-like FAD-dependent oxidoreductase